MLILLFLLAGVPRNGGCIPDDEAVEKLSKTMGEKFNRDICGQGIRPGGQKDVDFVNREILPLFLTKTWLTKDPPKGWEKEKDKIIAKCHKNTYNYCNADHRKKAGDCVKGMVGGLMLKYGATAMAYCPILDKKIENFEKDVEPQAMGLFTKYCKTKGKKC
jgi:hypothetical protein